MATYNPLEKRALAESVAKALLSRPVEPLPPDKTFDGAGIYVIYYTGDFPRYAPISDRNHEGRCDRPIYAGKAVPKGARKGGFSFEQKAGQVLYNRLKEHADSIKSTGNLKLDDFRCRYLAVDDIWIPLAESLLIEMFSPLWNKKVEGFGNHDPGKGRYAGKRSSWDTIHPGRTWADRCNPNRRNAQEILADVKEYLSN
jgi:hypothetical protein